jgi:hypothetical protein
MPTPLDVPAIVAEVRQRLAEEAQRGIHLQVAGERLDDDWLYVVVTPSQPGVRASDHARLMAQIERELRQQGNEHVLLVPTLED